MRLEGKVAIVTGGGTGIGAATARLFAAEGARVVVTARHPEPLDAVARDVEGLAVPGDIADADHVAAVVTRAADAFGGVDVVVANAAMGYPSTAITLDDDGWRRIVDVNVSGPLRLARAALPSMIARGAGSIVLVSSVSGLTAPSNSAAYVTTKHALIGLGRSMAVDFGPRGVRTNVLCPGWVVTPMGDANVDDLAELRGVDRAEAYRLATRHTPLRRPATAEEIARCCLFLASDESSIVNGAVLVADGGQTAVDLGGLAFEEDPP